MIFKEGVCCCFKKKKLKHMWQTVPVRRLQKESGGFSTYFSNSIFFSALQFTFKIKAQILLKTAKFVENPQGGSKSLGFVDFLFEQIFIVPVDCSNTHFQAPGSLSYVICGHLNSTSRQLNLPNSFFLEGRMPNNCLERHENV